ncbi:MAG: YncE family protein, partial [Gemmatimonadaceae bacterium]|nr:YncE family protein [Acetobacteraceae bacterium]
DAVAIVDLADPARPTLAGTLPLPNSVAGPPTNLQITRDGRLGLVASSLVNQPKDSGFTAVPDDTLHVIDLTTRPPVLIETIKVGRMPSGLAINRAGTLALVANRAGKSVSVLSIEGKTVRQVAEVPMEDEVAAVTISPDGRQAFVAKNTVHKVGVLAIDGMAVTYDKKLDMPVGLGVYNLDMTQDGRRVLTANTGVGGDGHADTISVIDATATPPRVIDHVTVGDGPEGFAVSPDGRHAIAALLRGTAAVHAAWSYGAAGALALLSVDGGRVRVLHQVDGGNLPEGVAFSADGRFAYVGNYVDRALQVFRIQDGKLVDTKTTLALPGQPASIGGVVR